MKALFDKETHYYKYITNNYDSGNAGGMYHYWDEYRAGATCAYIRTSYPTVITSLIMQIGGWTNEFHEGYVCNIILQGSNDNITWTTIKNWGDRAGCGTTHTLDCSENSTTYWYYRFYAENGGWAYNDALSVASVEYFGHYTTVQEVEEGQPYDYTMIGGKTYLLKEFNTRKYYKNIPWVQPVLTSNTSSPKMTISATNEGQGGAFQAFDNTLDNRWCTSNNVLSGTIYVQLNNPIYLNAITVKGYRNSYGYTNTVTIYDNNTKASLIGTSKTFYTSTGVEDTMINTWIFEEPIRVTQLAFDCIGGSYWVAIEEIILDAYTVEESTASDYDFYKDINKYYALKSYKKGEYLGGTN